MNGLDKFINYRKFTPQLQHRCRKIVIEDARIANRMLMLMLIVQQDIIIVNEQIGLFKKGSSQGVLART